MNWGLVPEIFFDVIGRVMPGCLLIVAAMSVGLGPRRASELILPSALGIGASALLLLALASYFVSVTLKQVWEWIGAMRKQKASGDFSVILHTIGRSQPAEAARLVKIQAEKNFCEVMIAGLGVLVPIDLWFLWAGSEAVTRERLWLLGAMLLSILTSWRWRLRLETLYRSSIETLKSVAENLPQIQP